MLANNQARSQLKLARYHGASALSLLPRRATRAHASGSIIDLCISTTLEGAHAGQTQGIVGSFQGWDIKKALPLVKIDQSRAEAQLTLPKGGSFEFKLVLFNGSDVQWEPGSNRCINLPSISSPLSKLHIDCSWGSADEMTVESDVETVPCQIIVPSVPATKSQSLILVGSSRSLGRWKPKYGLKLTRQGVTWTGHADLPASQATEAKLLLVDESKNLEDEWEFGEENRVIQPRSSSIMILHWGASSKTKILPLDSPSEAMKAVSLVASEVANASDGHRTSPIKPTGNSLAASHETEAAAKLKADEEEKRLLKARMIASSWKKKDLGSGIWSI